MAQSYFYSSSSRTSSPGPMSSPPPYAAANSFEDAAESEREQHSTAQEVESAYVEQQTRLSSAISDTQGLLTDVHGFLESKWTVRYPQLRDCPSTDEPTEEQAQSSFTGARRHGMRRSLSFADEPTFETEVVVNAPRKGLQRSVTLATITDEAAESPDASSEDDEDCLLPSSGANDFHVLHLDLKLGPHGSSTSPASLVTQLEKHSIAKFVGQRLLSVQSHLGRLALRVADKSSKVLVTGDLNAGKSTFVNTLLRRQIMPVDQQPCTTAFCEVHDALENDGTEELHIVKAGVQYDIHDESTFTRVPIDQLEEIISDNEDVQQIVKVYLTDGRPESESLINNGVVDISLIDAPGLNRDSMKTTAVFARQEEIDVVVFVVNAENHFTLSAKDFLFNASNEKAYLFIVVNKFDQIRDKAKCRRLILEQIKNLSPRTHDNAEDLVHFVDSSVAQQHDGSESFDTLEKALRSFVLVKRSKSKLQPASTYLNRVLSDIGLLLSTNVIYAKAELARAAADLKKALPELERMKSSKEALEEGIAAIEDAGASRARLLTKEFLTQALRRVGQGKLAIPESKTELRMPTYPGFFNIYDYACQVRHILLQSLDLSVKEVEDEARAITSEGVKKISQLGDKHLPEGVERSRRVFMPEAMFSASKDRRKARRNSQAGAIVAGGTRGLGIGLAQRPDMLETSLGDIFDAQHHFCVRLGLGGSMHGSDSDEGSLGVFSFASVGLGGLTVLGSQALGMRGAVMSFFRLSNLLDSETARKWIAPVVCVLAVGTTAYFIWELPSSVPRTIGRRIQTSLLRELSNTPESNFVDSQAARVSHETRKVLRLAGFDMKSNHTAAVDESARTVRTLEGTVKQTEEAVRYLGEVIEKTAEVREKAQLTEAA